MSKRILISELQDIFTIYTSQFLMATGNLSIKTEYLFIIHVSMYRIVVTHVYEAYINISIISTYVLCITLA